MTDVVPGSPSSLSSVDSDSDNVNTSSAKVYFGQFQSPEKKLAAQVDSVPQSEPNLLNVATPGPSSLRRSPRLSGSPLRKSKDNATEQSEQEEGQGGEGANAAQDDEITSLWREVTLPQFLRKDGTWLNLIPSRQTQVYPRALFCHCESHNASTRQSLAPTESRSVYSITTGASANSCS